MFAEKVKLLRKTRGITQAQFASEFNISNGTIAMWETGKREPDFVTIRRLADFFDVSLDYLLGDSETKKPPLSIEEIGGFEVGELVAIPVLGAVKAGPNGMADEQIEGFEMIPITDAPDGAENYFFLRVIGDSMTPRYIPGDRLLIKRQTSVDSGTNAIVIVNGEEGTVKRVFYGDDWIHLISENQNYPPRVFNGADVQQVYVIGRVISMTRKEM